MKNYLLHLAMVALFSLLLISCEEEKAPEAAFSATEGSSSDKSITINFSDNSSNSPSAWIWTFEGGTPSTSNESNPTVTFSSSGIFDVTLEVKNEGGTDQITLTDYISIVKFNNPTHTDIDISISAKNKTIPIDDYVLFASIDNTTLDIDAETYGTTTSGSQIGETITWEGSVDLTEYSSWNLDVNSDFIFFYVTNSGSDNLTPFYVNYDTNEETIDNIIIPNNNNTISTGYYYANSGMEVRAYFESSTEEGVNWIEGNNFTLRWEDNQFKSLGNELKNSEELKSVKKKIANPNAGNIYQSETK